MQATGLISQPSFLQVHLLQLLLVALFACVTAIGAGIRRWRQQNLESRPSAPGRIDDVTVGKPKGFLAGNSQQWEVRAHYSYSVAGEQYQAVYKRLFDGEVDAWDLAEALDEKNVLVHYAANKPAKSDLAEAAVQQLLDARSAMIAIPMGSGEVKPLFPHGKLWLTPLIVLAGLGLLGSVYVLIGSLMGKDFAPRVLVLHFFVFVVFFPAVLVMIALSKKTGRPKDVWKPVFNVLPPWAKFVFYGAIVLSVLFSTFRAAGRPRHDGEHDWLWFAASWFIFYGFSFLIFWAASRMRVRLLDRCPNGHPSAPGARHCPVCNRPLWRVVSESDRSSELQPL
jgi:hypothetical protein